MLKAGEYPAYRYEMGFMIGTTAIPDPKEFTGAVSDLDTMGKRDATGLLHRCMVATKHPLKLKYENIPWSLIRQLCSLMASDQFSFTYPDPAVGVQTITAYVGDREWSVVAAAPGCEPIGNLNFSVIEY